MVISCFLILVFLSIIVIKVSSDIGHLENGNSSLIDGETIVDEIKGDNMIFNGSYTIEGQLIDKETGEKVDVKFKGVDYQDKDLIKYKYVK